MAERRPIVLVDGELQELPQGDTTPGSGGGGGGSALGAWSDVLSSRAVNTSYQNDGTADRHVAIFGLNNSTVAQYFEISADGSTGWVRTGRSTTQTSGLQNLYAVIPPGHYYRLAPGGGTTNIEGWAEAQATGSAGSGGGSGTSEVRDETTVALASGEFLQTGLDLSDDHELVIHAMGLTPSLDDVDALLRLYDNDVEVAGTNYNWMLFLDSTNSGASNTSNGTGVGSFPLSNGRNAVGWGLESTSTHANFTITIKKSDHVGRLNVEVIGTFLGAGGAVATSRMYGDVAIATALTGFKLYGFGGTLTAGTVTVQQIKKQVAGGSGGGTTTTDPQGFFTWGNTSGAGTLTNWVNEDWDTENAFDPVTGIFTVPAALNGKRMLFHASVRASAGGSIYIQKDTAGDNTFLNWATDGVVSNHGSASVVIPVATGDQVRLQTFGFSVTNETRTNFGGIVLAGAASGGGGSSNTILNGTVDPTTEGADGDFYINTTTNTIFGPKATTWPAGVSLVGPAGADGTNGTNGTDGADGAPGADGQDGAIGYISNNTTNAGGLTSSGSAFASKGSIITPNVDILLESVTFNLSGSATQTVDVTVVRLSGTDGAATIDEIIHPLGTLSKVNPASGDIYEFATPLALAKDSHYGIIFVRTDGTATSALAISFPGSAAQDDPQHYWRVIDKTSGIRYASVAPALTDTPIDAGLTGPVDIDLRVRLDRGFIPKGGTTGQALVKLSDADHDVGFGDVATGGGATAPGITTEEMDLSSSTEIAFPANTRMAIVEGWVQMNANTDNLHVQLLAGSGGANRAYDVATITETIDSANAPAATALSYTQDAASSTDTWRRVRVLIENPLDGSAHTTFESSQIQPAGHAIRHGRVNAKSVETHLNFHAAAGSIVNGNIRCTFIAEGNISDDVRNAWEIPSNYPADLFTTDVYGTFTITPDAANNKVTYSADSGAARVKTIADANFNRLVVRQRRLTAGQTTFEDAGVYIQLDGTNDFSFGVGTTATSTQDAVRTLEWNGSTGAFVSELRSNINVSSNDIWLMIARDQGNRNLLHCSWSYDGFAWEFAHTVDITTVGGAANVVGLGWHAGVSDDAEIHHWSDDDNPWQINQGATGPAGPQGSTTLTERDPDARLYWRARGTVAGTFDGGAFAKIIFKDESGEAVYGEPISGSDYSASNDAIEGIFGAGTTGFWGGVSGAVAAGTSWIGLKFPKPVALGSIEIIARDSPDQEQMWDEFLIEYSDDGTNWFTLQTVDSSAAWTSNELKTFPVTSPISDLTSTFLSAERVGSNTMTGTVDLSTLPTGYKVVCAVVGQQDQAYLEMTLGGVEGEIILIDKDGDFDAISYFAFDGITANNAVAYTLVNGGGGTEYRHSIFSWAFPTGVTFDVVRGGPGNTVNNLEFTGLKGDVFIAAGTISGSSLTATGGGFTTDSASTLVGGTFHTAAFSKALTADEVLTTLSIGETGGGDDRTFAAGLVVKQDHGNFVFNKADSDRLAITYPITQEIINAATYSTVDSDFLGGRFKKVQQTCTITVEPGMRFFQSCTFVPTSPGMITFAPGTGVTINSPDSLLTTRVTGSPVTLIQDADTPNTYHLFGDLA